MGFLRNLAVNLRALGRGQPYDTARGFYRYVSKAGTDVTEESAMRYAAVQACVRVLSEDVASLPLHVYRRTDNGGKERAREHPLYELLHDQPNPDMTAASMREAMMVALLLGGNAYAFIEYAGSGRIKALWPLDASETRPYRDDRGRLMYRSGSTKLGQNEVLHIPGLSFDGLVGLSPIAYAREAVGLGLAAEQFGSTFFGEGTHMGGAISVPGAMSDEAFDRTKAQFNAAYKGMGNAHGVVLLEGGATFTPFGIPPEDAQFLETRKFQRSEIAAIYRVPPHLIGDLERATFSNIEHQDLAYLQRTLLPWLVRWEQAIRRSLLTEDERRTYLAEHDTSGFMRGDTQSRMTAYATAINSGVMTQNEARQRENLNPVPGGDTLLQPLNMVPAAMERALPFPHGAERRSAESEETADRYDGLMRALSVWREGEIAKVLQMADAVLSERSSLSAVQRQKLIEEVAAYYRAEAGKMPDYMRTQYAALAEEAFKRVEGELGVLAPSRKWFDRKLGYFCGDTMARLQATFRTEIERIVNAAVGDDVLLMDALKKKLTRAGHDQLYAEATNEGRMVVNGFIVKSYHKAGYHAVWLSGSTCCDPCQKLNGVVVTTLSPPLHKGCNCSVRLGQRIDESKWGTVVDIATGYAKLSEAQAVHSIYGALEYPPSLAPDNLDNYVFDQDPHHARKKEKHGVSLTDAQDFVRLALYSLRRSFRNENLTYTCYYSEKGGAYLRDGENIIRTAFYAREYDEQTAQMIEEAKSVVKDRK